MFWKLGGSSTNYVGCFFLDVICYELSLLFSLLFLAFFSGFFWFFVDALFWLEVAGLIFVFGWTQPPRVTTKKSYTFRNRDSEPNLHLPLLLGGYRSKFLADWIFGEKNVCWGELPRLQSATTQRSSQWTSHRARSRWATLTDGWIGWIRKGRTITRCWKKIAPGSCRLIFGHTRESKDNGVVEIIARWWFQIRCLFILKFDFPTLTSSRLSQWVETNT